VASSQHFGCAKITFSPNKLATMKKYLVEFIGVFFVVLTVVLAVNHPDLRLVAPLAVGAILAVMTQSGRHISGAHFNPAITIAMLLRGKTETSDAAVYMIAQVAGAGVAAAIGAYLYSCSGAPAVAIHSNHETFCTILAEFLGAFILGFVYLSSQMHPANNTQGMVMGVALLGAMYLFGNISGGFFNPATAIGAALTGMIAWGDSLLYLLSAMAGGAASATFFVVVNEPTDG
jgi:aquaporin Z